MNETTTSLEAAAVLNQKNWKDFSLLQLAEAGRVTPEISGKLASDWLSMKYKGLQTDPAKLAKELLNLKQEISRQIEKANQK